MQMKIHNIILRILPLLMLFTLLTPTAAEERLAKQTAALAEKSAKATAAVAGKSANTTAQTPNEKQARAIFDKAFDKLFGPDGCSLDYNLNVIGIFKNKGSIWKKGMKIKYMDDKHEGWMNNQTVYLVDKKHKEVDIYNSTPPKNQKSSHEFTFNQNYYKYSISNHSTTEYALNLSLKKGTDGTIKRIKAIVNKRTFTPSTVKVKVSFVWATLNISNYHQGIADENIFIYPAQKYAGYKITDHRNETN